MVAERNRLQRRHAELHHVREILRDGLVPGESADVGAVDDLQSSLQSFLERLLVVRSARAIALALGRVFR